MTRVPLHTAGVEHVPGENKDTVKRVEIVVEGNLCGARAVSSVAEYVDMERGSW